MISSFFYKGVSSLSSFYNDFLILPTQESSPTTITTKRPSPKIISVPLNKIGEGIL